MSDYKVQSVIFPKEKYSIKEAKKWLKENGLKSPKVDEKTNFYRFRQIDPHYIETEGYTNYITKKMGDSGIEMIIAYKGKKPRGMKGGQIGIGVLKGGSVWDKVKDLNAIDTTKKAVDLYSQLKGGIRKLKVMNKTGGALKVRQIKKFLEESYKTNPSNVDDYELDKELSNDITKVHYNKSKNHAVVTHRGSDDLQDWYENAKYAVGSTTGKHFQQAEDTQKKAEEKYGANNISVVAHSKGAIHAEKFGKNAKEIITLNKPVNAQDVLSSVPDKQYDIKTSGDPVSKLRGLQRGKKAIVIKSKTFSNPLTEHSINVLDRLPENQVIGDTSIGGSRPEFAKDGSKIIYCGGALTDAYTTGQKLKCFYKVGELKTKLREWLSTEGKTKKEITTFLKGKKKQDVINDLLKMTDIRKTVPQDTAKVLKCKYKVGELKKEIRSKLEQEGKTKKEITAFLKGKKKADLLQYATPLVESVKTGKSADVIKKAVKEYKGKEDPAIKTRLKMYKQLQDFFLEKAVNYTELSFTDYDHLLNNNLEKLKEEARYLLEKTGHKYGEFLPPCKVSLQSGTGEIPTYLSQLILYINSAYRRVREEERTDKLLKDEITGLEEKVKQLKNPKKTKALLEQKKEFYKNVKELDAVGKEKSYLDQLVDAFKKGRFCVGLDYEALRDARYKRGIEERRKKLEEERKRKEEELKLIEEQKRKMQLAEIKKRLDKIKVVKALGEYAKKKREKKKSDAEQKQMGLEDFNVPQPAKAPTDIEPVVNRIDEKIKRLAEEGEKHGAVSYDASTIVTDIAFVLLMKRYGGRCLATNIMKTKGIDLGIDINNMKTRTAILHDNTILERFGEKLKECISRGIGLICIPLSLKFGTSHSGHANMLVYRPFKRLVERFEPHGVAYGNSMSDNKSFNDQLKDLWENKMTRFIGEVRFRTPEEVCPNPKGFQSFESSLKGLAKEGGGFCSMWSFFLAEMTFLNPEKSTTEIIDEVFTITAKDPAYLKSVIRGYVLEVDREMNNLFKEMGKGTFHLGKGSWKHVRGDEDAFSTWIIQNVFDSQKYSEAPPNYEPLPNVIGAINDKSDEEKLKETYITRLNSLTKDDLGRINGLYGLREWNTKKEQIITALVSSLMENRWAKYGSTGIKDLDYILDEGLYKKKDYKGRIAPSGYFIKKRDENK